MPTYHMLFESYVLMGAAQEHLLEVFSAADGPDRSVYRQSRRVARPREESAGGYHMCSSTLMDEQLPYVMAWLRTHL